MALTQSNLYEAAGFVLSLGETCPVSAVSLEPGFSGPNPAEKYPEAPCDVSVRIHLFGVARLGWDRVLTGNIIRIRTREWSLMARGNRRLARLVEDFSVIDLLHPVTIGIAVACVPVAAVTASAAIDLIAHRQHQSHPNRGALDLAPSRAISTPEPPQSPTGVGAPAER